ncbi:class I SAM-dependent methyltransferase [candidate division WOR-3 bacterium]|jgi:ubiquinone/menaquinone biosynthesis C-methylase UbiE|nr:class I SAM-dependent methyltransferase [candidate division WOR-3 bacterium]
MKMSKLEKIFVNPSARARNIKVIEQLFSQIDLSNVKKLLEVGCGIGVLSSYLSEKYKWEVTGIDLDPEQIKKAKKDHGENKYLKFLEADVTKLPFEDNEFDLVLSSDALHHVVANWDKALNGISRVLRTNGFYVLNDLTFPRFSFFKKWSIPIDDVINYMKRNNFKIIYEKKPKITIMGWRFSIVFQKSPNGYHK